MGLLCCVVLCCVGKPLAVRRGKVTGALIMFVPVILRKVQFVAYFE